MHFLDKNSNLVTLIAGPKMVSITMFVVFKHIIKAITALVNKQFTPTTSKIP